MKHNILIGQTDYTVLVFIPDPASTDGSGKTGLVAANLTASMTRVETDNDVVVTDVTSSLNDLAALTSAHNDWGLKEVSSTTAPGLYRLDLADGVFSSGAWSAVVYVMITTSAAAASPMEFILTADDFTVAHATSTQATNIQSDTDDIQTRLPAALTSNGNMKSSMVEILTTALTETAGLLAGGFKKFFNVSSPTGTLNSIPDAVAGAADGLFIAGTNAPVTITGSGDALTLTSTGSNGSGLNATGNGSGHGLKATGGVTGDGTRLAGGATSGDGFRATGGADGHGARFNSGSATGNNGILSASNGSGGAGILANCSFGNGDGLKLAGLGTGSGLKSTGGATGHGVLGIGGGTSGDGAHFNSQAGNSDGMQCTGDGTGFDINANIQGTISGTVNCDVIKISGDSTAADNAEAFFDGTGYAGTNNVIPLVTVTSAVTGFTPSDVTAIKAKTDNLPSAVKRNVALPDFEFLMVLASDHVTGATGLSVTAQRSIDGGAFAACANSVSEIGNGIYAIDLDASDLNGGVITLLFSAATADDRFVGVVTNA